MADYAKIVATAHEKIAAADDAADFGSCLAG
jgi:hypothetical protein